MICDWWTGWMIQGRPIINLRGLWLSTDYQLYSSQVGHDCPLCLIHIVASLYQMTCGFKGRKLGGHRASLVCFESLTISSQCIMYNVYYQLCKEVRECTYACMYVWSNMRLFYFLYFFKTSIFSRDMNVLYVCEILILNTIFRQLYVQQW